MAKIARTDSDRQAQSLLRAVLLHALPIALLVLALLAYWFGRADRYLVFLYYHDMGPLVPDTSPFSPVTASRYWMSGLVAAGFVLVLYASLNWLFGRLREGYAPPPWALVWLICLPLLLLGIPLITMSLNSPVLPWDHAARVTFAALAGLALALPPAPLAARRPSELLWLLADGCGLSLILATLAQLDDIVRWTANGLDWRAALSISAFALGLAWLLFLTWLRAWRGTAVQFVLPVYMAGICVAYLLLPLAHYLFFSDGYFYITDSDNFLAGSIPLQLLTWLLTAVLVWALVSLRRLLDRRLTRRPVITPK